MIFFCFTKENFKFGWPKVGENEYLFGGELENEDIYASSVENEKLQKKSKLSQLMKHQ